MLVDCLMDVYTLFFPNTFLSKPITNKRQLSLLRCVAGRGNPLAALRLGELYLKGVLVPRHLTTGMQWLEKAADGGVARAWGLLAKAKASGGVSDDAGFFSRDDTDPVKAEDILFYAAKGADLGDVESAGIVAQVKVGTLGLTDLTCRSDVLKAAQMGHAWSQALASQMAAEGTEDCFLTGLTAHESAVEWANRSLKSNPSDPHPYFHAARLVAGRIAPGGVERAKVLMKKAADMGHAEAAINYGCQLLRERDELHGVSYLQGVYRTSSSPAGAHAAAILGDFYFKAKEVDLDLAVDWYIRAAEAGHEGAEKMLAALYHQHRLSPIHEDLVRTRMTGLTKHGPRKAA